MKNAKWFCDMCIVQADNALTLLEMFNELKGTIINQLNEFKRTLDKKISNTQSPDNKNNPTKTELKSYADVAKNVVIIKPKKEQESNTTKQDIQKYIRPQDLEVGIAGVRNISKGGMIIECDKKEDTLKVKEAVEEKLPERYNVRTPELINPSIKILDIQDYLAESQL